ncbi:MAG: MaoC family dehydratase N-terminal domain-containing protein [Myxococcota bacterium]
MPLDQSLVGRATEPVVWDVEKGHIRAFALAIGDANPVYFDEAAAHAAGLPKIPAPPTFPTALRPRDPREGVAIDWRKLLHGEQSYELLRPLFAGDRISVVARIADVTSKQTKAGVMDVLVIETVGTDAATGETIFVGRGAALIRR